MEFKHRRGNLLILFEKLTEIPLLVLGILVSAFLLKNLDEQALFPIAAIIINPLARLINYLFTYYTLSENYLIIESGVFTKKRTEIPFTSITTVDLSQNILFQFFKVYKIKVDNASQTNEVANKSNVNLALKVEEAILFKQIITQNHREEAESDKEINEIKAQTHDFIKLGLLQSKFIYIFSIIAVVGPLSGLIAPKLENVLIGGFVVAFVLIIYLLAIGVSVVKSVISYYDFRVSATEDFLKVQYGLINKKSFTLPKGKINGIILKQNFFMRLCKLYTAEVIVIGYGDASDEGTIEKAIIYPIGSMERIKDSIRSVLPEYGSEYTLCKAEPQARKYFFYSTEFILAVILFLASFIVSLIIDFYIPIAVAAAILIISILSVVFKFNNAGISVGKENVTVSSGAFHKKIAIVKTDSIESITSSGSIFKRNRGYVSIKIGIIAPLRVGNIASLNISLKQFDILKGVLKY